MAPSRSLARYNPFHDPHDDTLSHHLAALTRELRPIARALSRQGGEALHDARHTAGDLAGDFARRGGSALHEASHSAGELAHVAGELAQETIERLTPVARRAARQIGERAQYAGQALRSDPLPAVVALGTATLIAALLLRRR
jgi:hypothetical protein